MARFKTVDSEVDPLLKKQRQAIDEMRTSLLMCDSGDEATAMMSLKNITVLRVYHQISRIIRYLEMMDKIEAKLYDSLEVNIDTMDIYDTSTLVQLLGIQEKLQANLIESHKLLQPYLDFQKLGIDSLVASVAVNSSAAKESMSILDQSSRDKIRSGAQQVLTLLKGGAGADAISESSGSASAN